MRLCTECCAIFHLLVRFRTNYRWICTGGFIMLVRNRTKYRCLFHFMVRFRSDLSQLLERFQADSRYYSSNSWYDFVPIIAGTDLYATFSNNYCWYDFVPITCDWVCAICLICWNDFVPIMAGLVIFPLAGTISYRLLLVYSITGVFYLLVRCRTSYRWLWAAGRSLLCFSRSR